MAITVAKLSASPYSLKYDVDAVGLGGATLLSAAQVLNDCMKGPLKNFLSAINSGVGGAGGIADWNLLEQGPYLSVLITQTGNTNVTGGFTSGPNGFFVQGTDAAANVEIRLWHSPMR